MSLGKWKKLRYLEPQQRIWKENKRFAVIVAGRRSGKTELAKRKLARALCYENKARLNKRYFAAAPTRGQAKRIFWEDLKSLIPKKLIKKISETDLTIKTIFGSELAVVGLDNPQRIEGAPWDGCVLDEYANMRPQAWSENVRPALSDRNGWCWFLGVPEGLNHFKDLADFAKSENVKEQGQWGFYTWPSSIVLPPEEIEAAKRDLDLKTFRQEYEASFEQAGGRVYYSYNRDINERDDLVINERQQINLCCDFNVSPCIWLIVQTLKIGKSKVVAVIDEIVLHNTNTKEMCEEFIKRYSNLMGNVVVYGDSAGSFRSTAGVTDYAIMNEMGFKVHRIKKANPAVKDRVNAVNAMLLSTANESKLFHHPRCLFLKKDFETIQWKEGSMEIDKSDSNRTHSTDALGYFIDYEFPLRLYKQDNNRRFYK